MGILDMPPGKITGGEILLPGQDMLAHARGDAARSAAPEIAMIFQDALSSLNPVLTVG